MSKWMDPGLKAKPTMSPEARVARNAILRAIGKRASTGGCEAFYTPQELQTRGASNDERVRELQLEIRALEAEVSKQKQLLDVAHAFHDVAVKERDYERVVNNRMRAALEAIANPAAIGSAFHEEVVARARREL